MKETIKIETKNVKVGKRYWSFDYKVWRNGKPICKGNLDSSHSRSPKFMRNYLKTGGATEQVISREFY